MGLTELQRQLCDVLQKGLPICWRPFAHIAKLLNSNEQEILQQISQLKKAGVIRRIGAVINYNALGKTSTLVTAHIPQQHLGQVVQAVNRLDGVSHNYLRQHYYNLWFTLQANRPEQIDSTLSNLSQHFGITFYSLPARCVFKLDARFPRPSSLVPRPSNHQLQINNLADQEKLILWKLQGDLNVVAEPFDFFCQEGLARQDVLRIIQGLIDKGGLKRIGAVVDHRKLGFVANALFVCKVEKSKIGQAGKRLATLSMVSHCYERETFEDWPFNLFAMMHSKSFRKIEQMINRFAEAEKIDLFELLPTLAELKKQAVKIQFF